jgi:hypothetical protein
MNNGTIHRLAAGLALSAVLASGSASAAVALSDKFSGTFAMDDDVALIPLSLPAAGTYHFRSVGYGGATLADGTVVAPGGFDTMLAFYAADGSSLIGLPEGALAPYGVRRFELIEDSASANPDPDTGQTYDDEIIVELISAGDFTLAVTQFDNQWLGALDLGFAREGEGNFTPDLFPWCPDGVLAFCDDTGDRRTGEWVIEMTATVVPLPAALPLFVTAMIGIGWAGRRASA